MEGPYILLGPALYIFVVAAEVVLVPAAVPVPGSALDKNGTTGRRNSQSD